MLPDMYFKRGNSDYEGLYGLPPQSAWVDCTVFNWVLLEGEIPGIEPRSRVWTTLGLLFQKYYCSPFPDNMRWKVCLPKTLNLGVPLLVYVCVLRQPPIALVIICSVAEADLELSIHLPPPSKCWDLLQVPKHRQAAAIETSKSGDAKRLFLFINQSLRNLLQTYDIALCYIETDLWFRAGRNSVLFTLFLQDITALCRVLYITVS